MAEAGFYFTEFCDQVACPFCGIHVRGWQPRHNPRDEHSYWSPTCSFVSFLPCNLSVGERVCRAEVLADAATVSINDRGEEGCAVRESGSVTYETSPLLPEGANYEVFMRMRPGFLTSEQLERLRLLIFRVAESSWDPRFLFLPSERLERGGSNTVQPSACALSTTQANAVQMLSESTDVALSPVYQKAQEAEQLIKSIVVEMDTIFDTLKCIICMDKRKEFIFFPCGHFCTCASCGLNMIRCPLCRALIQRMNHVYL
jgi:hypothetical protein